MRHTVISAVGDRALATPNNPALIVGGEIVTYGGLWHRVRAACEMIREFGVEPGDRVILSADASNASFVYGYLATHLLGGIAVPVDPQTPSARLALITERVGASAIFMKTRMEESAIPVRPIGQLGSADGSSIPAFRYPKPSSAADILFTTGTTGEPKGVVLTHHNIFSAATNINAFIGNSSQDREVVPLPLSHSFGLGRLRCNLLAGGAIILVDGLTFPGQFFNAISQSKATGLSFVPAGLALLLRLSNDRLGDYVNQLRYVEIGSAPMSVEDKEYLMRLLPRTRICMHYGLTEASRAVFIEFHESARWLESIGRGAPNVEIRIVNPDTGQEAPENTLGKIMIRGENVMQGYWNEPDRTQEVLNDGWLYTGDYGYRDHDGYFYLEARERELINIGGRKLSPAEIERVLQKHPDIASCACIGIVDPRGVTGEAVKAYIVAKDPAQRRPGNSDIVEFLRESLEPYKVPVEFCWIDSLPTTPSGKIQRAVLRTMSERD